MSTIVIKSNSLRLMSKVFLVLIPLKLDRKGEVKQDGKYNCEVEGIGDVGQIEVMNVHEVHMYELKPATLLLAEANTNYVKKMEGEGYYSRNKVQVAYCHFLKRKSEPFIKLWEQEAKNIGVIITKQPALF